MSRALVIRLFLVVAAIVNLVPVLGVLSGELIARAYGIPHPTGDLFVLLRHRALLFGIVGGIMATSVVRAHLQPVAIVAGLVSMLGFIVFTLLSAPVGPEILRLAVIDAAASIGLLVALWLRRVDGTPQDEGAARS